MLDNARFNLTFEHPTGHSGQPWGGSIHLGSGVEIGLKQALINPRGRGRGKG